MEHYIGVKEIDAEPMNRGDYNEYRGWAIPENEDPTDEGYLVKYPDGYESWSPKEVFEKAYTQYDGTGLMSTVDDMRSPDYKKRFLAQYRQLAIRVKELQRMLDKYTAGKLDFKPTCPPYLLYKQYVHMADYLDDLNMRAAYEGIDVHGAEANQQG
ncbi:MAG: hypothetical protein IJ709_01870 [Selenomonas sp.]|nr:hypothetical protein [Selenomonas sp.]